MNEYTNDDGSLKVLTARKFAVWTAPKILSRKGRKFYTRKAAQKFREKYVQDEWYVCYHKGGDENGPKRLAMKVGGKPFKRSINDSSIVFWIGIGILAFPVVILILYCSADEIEETHLDEQDKPYCSESCRTGEFSRDKPRERMDIFMYGCVDCCVDFWTWNDYQVRDFVVSEAVS